MAWNRHAVAQTQLRKHVASTAWDAGPKFDFHTGGELLVVDGNTKSIISHGLGHGVLHYLSVTQGGLSRSEPLITRETPWYVAAGLLLSSFGLFFDLLERTEFPPWLKTTQAVATEADLRDTRVHAHSKAASGGYADFVYRCISGREPEWQRGRNNDVVEATLEREGLRPLKFAIATGFRNVQRVVAALKRPTPAYDFVELLACPVRIPRRQSTRERP